jgi:hypothetical protein
MAFFPGPDAVRSAKTVMIQALACNGLSSMADGDSRTFEQHDEWQWERA